jgi:hypothetical protein
MMNPYEAGEKTMPRSFAKITRARMRAHQPGERITEQGITFERLDNGDGLFSVNVMADGQRIHRNIGRESEGVTRTTAEEFISKARREAQEGRLNLPKRRKVPLTLATATPLYLDRLRQEGGKDIERKAQRLEQFIIPFLGEMQIDKITSFDVERYKRHRLGQPVQSRKMLEPGQTPPTNRPATVNRELSTLSQLIHKAVEWGWIERLRVRIRKLKEDNGRILFDGSPGGTSSGSSQGRSKPTDIPVHLDRAADGNAQIRNLGHPP